MREVYDDSQRTAGQKSFSKQSSRPPDDEVHEMGGGETLPEPDTAVTSSSSRGEKRTENTRERVREKTADDSVTKATDHTCPTS